MEASYTIGHLQNDLHPRVTNKTWKKENATVVEDVKFSGSNITLSEWPSAHQVIIKNCHFTEGLHISGKFLGDIVFQECKF